MAAFIGHTGHAEGACPSFVTRFTGRNHLFPHDTLLRPPYSSPSREFLGGRDQIIPPNWETPEVVGCVSPGRCSLCTPTLESRLGNCAHGVGSTVFFSRTKAAPSRSHLQLHRHKHKFTHTSHTHTHTLCSSTSADITLPNIFTSQRNTPVYI